MILEVENEMTDSERYEKLLKKLDTLEQIIEKEISKLGIDSLSGDSDWELAAKCKEVLSNYFEHKYY